MSQDHSPTFIPPHVRLRVLSAAERTGKPPKPIRPVTIPTGSRAAALATEFAQSRARIDTLIARDAKFKADQEAKRRARQQSVAPSVPRPPKRQGRDAYDSMPAAEFIYPGSDTKAERKRRAYKKAQRKLQIRLARQREKSSVTGWQQEYNAYIRSREWQAFRQRIFRERGRKCETCGVTDRLMHVHHLHYRNFRNEKPADVKVLCEPCHRAVHA